MYGIKGVITRTNVHEKKIKENTININIKKMEEFIQITEKQIQEQQSFENQVREVGTQLIKILEDERKKTQDNYYKVMSTTSVNIRSRDAKRFAKRLDYFDKGIERVKKGIEISILGAAIVINEDEAEVIVNL